MRLAPCPETSTRRAAGSLIGLSETTPTGSSFSEFTPGSMLLLPASAHRTCAGWKAVILPSLPGACEILSNTSGFRKGRPLIAAEAGVIGERQGPGARSFQDR